jgi:TonB family protein
MGKFDACLLATLFAAAAGSAHAQWRAMPSNDDLAAVYPAIARDAGLSGRVELSCVVAKEGNLTRCAVALEGPADLRFGSAALALAPKFRMDLESDRARQVIGKRIRVPIVFGGLATTPPFRGAVFSDAGAYKHLAPQGPYWPERALRAGASGVVVADCAVASTGRLTACVVVSANPDGLGFADAVLKMSSQGFMIAAEPPPQTAAAGDVWRFRVEFSNPNKGRRSR